MGLTLIEVNATTVIPWFILSVSSLIFFAMSDIINYSVGIILLIGMAVGGYAGAHFALQKGNIWIRRFFVLFVIVSSIKLFFS